MKALISIDYTWDFVATQGALTTGLAGQAIETRLVQLTQSFIEQGHYIIFAIDCHEPNDLHHPEQKLFPPHNILGSPGQRLYGALHTFYQDHKHNPSIYYLPKRRYSAFCGTDLDIRLRERAISEIHLSGVCTDICVLHTAIDAYQLGYHIVVHEEATASFDPTAHDWAIRHMRSVLGANIVEAEKT